VKRPERHLLCVVHQDLNAAKRFDDFVDASAEVAQLLDVALNGQSDSGMLFDQAAGFLDLRKRAPHRSHLRAVLRESASDALADPLARSRNDGDSSRQHDRFSLP
jgi:hypothetical protein